MLSSERKRSVCYYVHPYGNDDNDGLAPGPDRAFRTVGRAIDVFNSNPWQPGKIYVEDGVYDRPTGYPAENIRVIK